MSSNRKRSLKHNKKSKSEILRHEHKDPTSNLLNNSDISKSLQSLTKESRKNKILAQTESEASSPTSNNSRNTSVHDSNAANSEVTTSGTTSRDTVSTRNQSHGEPSPLLNNNFNLTTNLIANTLMNIMKGGKDSSANSTPTTTRVTHSKHVKKSIKAEITDKSEMDTKPKILKKLASKDFKFNNEIIWQIPVICYFSYQFKEVFTHQELKVNDFLGENLYSKNTEKKLQNFIYDLLTGIFSLKNRLNCSKKASKILSYLYRSEIWNRFELDLNGPSNVDKIIKSESNKSLSYENIEILIKLRRLYYSSSPKEINKAQFKHEFGAYYLSSLNSVSGNNAGKTENPTNSDHEANSINSYLNSFKSIDKSLEHKNLMEEKFKSYHFDNLTKFGELTNLSIEEKFKIIDRLCSFRLQCYDLDPVNSKHNANVKDSYKKLVQQVNKMYWSWDFCRFLSLTIFLLLVKLELFGR